MSLSKVTEETLNATVNLLRSNVSGIFSTKEFVDNELKTLLWNDPVRDKFEKDYKDAINVIVNQLVPEIESYIKYIESVKTVLGGYWGNIAAIGAVGAMAGTAATTGRGPSLNENMAPANQLQGVYEVLSKDFNNNPPNDIDQYFRDKFNELHGYDITKIINKSPGQRSPEESKVLDDYKKFREDLSKQIETDCDEEISNIKRSDTWNVMNSAIPALDCYGDDTKGWINNSTFSRVDPNNLPSDVRGLYDVIESCNMDPNNFGFHAELYFDKEKNAYQVAFRGTEFDLEDIPTDVQLGITSLSEKTNPIEYMKVHWGSARMNKDVLFSQYEYAITISQAIKNLPDEVKRNLIISGHSLGGGLASIVGLSTGVTTNTFNAAHVPNKFLKQHGLYYKVQMGNVQNIKAYHTWNDPLTVAQKIGGAEAIGVGITLENVGDGHSSKKIVQDMWNDGYSDMLYRKKQLEERKKQVSAVDPLLQGGLYGM